MNDLDQWLMYGMLACLMRECDEEHVVAEWMATEADGEEMLEEFEKGVDEMYAWLCRQRRSPRPRIGKFRLPIHYGGWPLTLH